MPLSEARRVHERAQLLNEGPARGNGNGRTSRILSFYVLSVKLGFVLPGTPTFPELVKAHRHAYEDALDLADDACKQGHIDVSAMKALIESLLARQLAHVYELAGGRAPGSS